MAHAKQEASPSSSPQTYLPFVHKVARRVARRLPNAFELEELVSAGTVGLMEAVDRFEGNDMSGFKTYAEYRIKGAIYDELRRHDPVNRAARRTQQMIADKTRELTGQLERPPEAHELAAAMNLTVEEFNKKMSGLSSIELIPMDQDFSHKYTTTPDQEEATQRKELLGHVMEALEELPERQRMVLSLYYLEGLGQAQIAGMIGVTDSRVSQILSASVAQLRKRLARLES